jgi:hypothetical protein
LPNTRLLIEMADDPFALDVEKLRHTPGWLEVFDSLINALAELRKYDHYEEFPKLYSVYGDDYTYRLSPGYFLIYKRKVEKLPRQPVTVTLELLSIQAA